MLWSKPSEMPEITRITATEDGATAVEFALVAPMFLMLVFGAIEFGRVLWTEQALQETALAGARCMAIAQGTNPNGSCTSSGSYSSTGKTKTYMQNVASGWGLTVPSAGHFAKQRGKLRRHQRLFKVT